MDNDDYTAISWDLIEMIATSTDRVARLVATVRMQQVFKIWHGKSGWETRNLEFCLRLGVLVSRSPTRRTGDGESAAFAVWHEPKQEDSLTMGIISFALQKVLVNCTYRPKLASRMRKNESTE